MNPISKLLFIDIETVPAYPDYASLPDNWKALWDKKCQYINPNNIEQDTFYQRAGIYAEFGKIVCISTGLISSSGETRHKSFYGHQEKDILQKFADLLNQYYPNEQYSLVAHNGKEFDFPYIARRMLVNGVKIPFLLNNSEKKPWEIHLKDTLEMWKFGDYKHYVSLDVLTQLFDIESPKDDMNGADVYKTYYQEQNLEKIVRYCEKDVTALIQVYLALSQNRS